MLHKLLGWKGSTGPWSQALYYTNCFLHKIVYFLHLSSDLISENGILGSNCRFKLPDTVFLDFDQFSVYDEALDTKLNHKQIFFVKVRKKILTNDKSIVWYFLPSCFTISQTWKDPQVWDPLAVLPLPFNTLICPSINSIHSICRNW